jgi:hypothetical protein
MINSILVMILAIFCTGCVSLPNPYCEVCISANNNSNPKVNDSIFLPVHIVVKLGSREEDLANFSAKNINNIDNEKYWLHVYPSESKCMKIEYTKENSYLAVIAIFNKSKGARYKHIEKIPRRLFTRRVNIVIEQNTIIGK